MNIKETVNPDYLDSNNIKELKEEFNSNKPFPHLELEECFNPEILEQVIQGFTGEKFEFKESDLFKFKQTKDFQSTNSNILKKFREFLKSPDFIQFMEDITGLKLKKDTIDLHGTLYENTDFLLPHDDKLDTRKIAFLIYLSDMKEEDGGSLDLYSSDSHSNKPTKISQKIIPKFNKFAFFQVSNKSYHQVAEVLNNKQRLAIGGWFHA